MTSQVVKPPPAPKQKKKHWILRIFVAIAVLLLVAASVVQVVLWTDLPRGIVVSQIEKQLGLRLSVKTLTTGWLGHTQLNDVTIGLPLSDKSFLEVPTMKVKNTSLFGLLLGQSVAVEAIELDHPHLYVWQDSNGQWNLQQVAQLLAQAGGQKPGEQSAATSSTPAMPNVHLTSGTITIIDNQKRTIDIQPVKVDGYADTGVSWKYDVDIARHVSLTGRLVPGGTWDHEVAAKIQDVGTWAKPWTSDFPSMAIDVSWRGQLNPGGVAGRLEIHNASLGGDKQPIQATGAITANAGSAGVTLHPDNLLLKTGVAAAPELRLASGSINFDPTSKDLKVDQLLVALFGGSAKVGGSYNLSSSAGAFEADWEKLALPHDIVHSGKLAVTMSRPFPDKFVVDGNLVSSGKQGPASWMITAAMAATGSSVADFDWKFDAHQLQWERHVQAVNLDGLHLNGGLHNHTATVASINLPNKDLLSGSASYQLSGDQSWDAHLQGQNWPFSLVPGTQLGFIVNARGDQKKLVLENLLLKSPDATISANAIYTLGAPKPLNLNLTITNAAPTQAPAALASNTQAKILNGTIDGHANIRGTLDPLQLQIRGGLNGRELDIRGHHIGSIAAVLSDDSRIDTNGCYLATDSLNLFGGKWNIDGLYDPDWNDVQIDVGMKDASLKQLAGVADQENIDGRLSGRLSVAVPGLNFDPNHLRVLPSSFTFTSMNVYGVAVDELDATLSLVLGHFEINPIHFKHAEGTGDVRITTDLSNFRRIEGSIKINTWPIDIPGAEAHMDASLNIPGIVLNLPDAKSPDPARQTFAAVANQIDLHATTAIKGDKIGDLVAHAGVDGNTVDLRGLHMQLLGGRLDGQAHARLDQPLESTAEFTWENLELKEMARTFPQINEMHGTLTGSARLAPTTVSRPREPLALVITSRLENGGWRKLQIKDLRLATYFGPNPAEVGGGWRAVMEDSSTAPSFIHLAGGTVELWGRAGFHGRATSSQAQITFRDLDLNQFASAADSTAPSMPARLAGSIMVIRAPIPAQPVPSHATMFPSPPTVVIEPLPALNPNDPPLKKLIDPIFAECHIEMTKTNLGDVKAVAFLYHAANLFQSTKKTDATGDVQFHLEKGTLTIEHLRYFNQGTEIRAVAAIKDIWKMPYSPVIATASLTERPLSSVKLPFLSGFDTALTSIERSLHLTSVRVTRTVHDPKLTQLGLSELGEQMKSLLVSDVKGEGGEGG